MPDLNHTSGPTSPAMRLLAAGIPLSLLCDLFYPVGPDSRGIIAHEREHARAAPMG